MNADKELRVSQEGVVRQPKAADRYPIKIREWNKLKEMIEAIVPSTRWYEVIGSISAGVSLTAGGAIIGLWASKVSTSSLWALSVSLFVIGAVVATAFFCAQNTQQDRIVVSRDAVLDEMKFIETEFSEEKVAESLPTPALSTGQTPQ